MDLPVVGGFGVAALVIVFRLLTERAEIRDLRADVVELKTTLATLDERYSFQRHRAHLYREAITRMVSSVDLAAMLTTEAVTTMNRCRCDELDAIRHALEPIGEILSRLNAETKAVVADVNRRSDEPA